MEMPTVDVKKIELYLKYLEYVHVILKVLTKKAKYSGQVKEAERTGQYLSNLYMSIQGVGREFVNKHAIVKYFTEGYKHPDLTEKALKISMKVKAILDEFGFKRPTK